MMMKLFLWGKRGKRGKLCALCEYHGGMHVLQSVAEIREWHQAAA